MKKHFSIYSVAVMLLFSITALAQPTITSFSPASGPVGTTTVTIIGTNFNATAANDAVYFGATKATVLTASTTTLTVTVPVGATYRYISVTNTATNLTAYSAKPFISTFTCGDGIGASAFATKVDSAGGTNPAGIAICDIDGNGKADIVAADFGSNKISVLRNTSSSGSISYAYKTDFTTGTSPYGIATGDFDGDGDQDVVVANSGANTVSVFKNTSTSGTISFAAKSDFGTGTQPYNVAVGDIDGDGLPDIAITNNGAGTMSVLRNTTTGGTISFATKVDFTAGVNPWGITIGDLDGNGKVDVSVTIQSPPSVSAFRNTSTSGSVSFATKVSFGTGAGPSSVAIGDLDADGKPDLVTGNYASGNAVSLLRNTSVSGTISFASKVDLNVGSGPISVAIDDLDGDAKLDLAIADADIDKASILKNTSTSGSFSFLSKVDFTTGALPYDITIGDIDGDGKPDLALPDFNADKVSTLRNLILVPPVMTSTSSATICSGTQVSINLTSSIASTYTWVAASNANVTGESTTNQTTSTINNTLTNTTTSNQAVTYSVIPTSSGGCGVGNTQTVTVTVLPAPAMTSASSTTICNGDTLDVQLTANLSANYTWITTNNPNTTGEDTTLQTIDSLNSIIYNYTTSNQLVTYTVTPYSLVNGCQGTVQTVSITVRPAPQMTSASSATICSGTTLAHSLTSNVASSYQWVAANNTHITGESTTPQSGSTINNTLTSDTTNNQTVSYTVTPTSTTGSCIGVQQTVSVLVSPLPTVTSASVTTICSGGIVNIQLTSGVASTYSWVATNNANTTGENTTVTVSSSLIDTITNNTYSVQVVTYTVTPKSVAGNCLGTAQTVSVTVRPALNVSFSGLANFYCSNADTVPLSGSPRGGVFSGFGMSDTSFVPGNSGGDTIVISYFYLDTLTGCSKTVTDTTFVGLPPEVGICMLTVNNNKNRIIWEKPDTTNIDSFRIYREIASSFVHIASQSYTVTSQYDDVTTGVDPSFTSYKYAISVIDTCGNESPLSPYHQTIHLAVSPSIGCGYILQWNDYIGFPVLQYRILRDTNTTAWEVIDSVSFGNGQYWDTTCFDANDTVEYVIEIETPECTPSKLQNPVNGMSYWASHSNVWNTKTMSNGVNENTETNTVSIYPNPFTSQTTISLAKELKDATLRITDVLGKEVKTMNFSGNKVVVDRERMEAGVYSVQVISETGITASEKLIIQ